MPVTFSAAYLAELDKGINSPHTIIEIVLDSGSVKFGEDCDFADVISALEGVKSNQVKIDPEKGYAGYGTITFDLIGRENFKDLIKDNYLKNRRIYKKEGFIADGFDYSEYAETFTGLISNWSRKGDRLTITATDDLKPATKKIPVPVDANTQYLDYSDTNPVNIMTNMILTQDGVPSARVESTQFTSERDKWLNGFRFQRILVEPKETKEHLNDLQVETNSFIINDGAKISYKVFAPREPGQTYPEIGDTYHILEDSVKQESGYLDHFYNAVAVAFDYDESGDDKWSAFENVIIASDSDSQSSSEWDETKTKIIKSKWIKTYTFSQPSNITGLVLYHVSASNGLNAGKTGSQINWNAANKTLTWTAPDGTVGDTVTVEQDGRYDLYDADQNKYVRVIATYASLPGTNQSDTINITAIGGESFARSLAYKLLRRYRDPVSPIEYSLDMNDASNDGDMWKPTDFVNVTTDDACVHGKDTLASEPMMLLSVRPDNKNNRIGFSAIQTKIYKRYGFIAPNGYPDYGSATDAQKEYAFICTTGSNLCGGTDDGYYIW